MAFNPDEYLAETNAPFNPDEYLAEGQQAPQNTESRIVGGIQSGLDIVSEFAAGVNRGVITMADVPAQIANAVLELLDSEKRVPKIADTSLGIQVGRGGFMEPGLARQFVRELGEMAAPSIPMVKMIKGSSSADDMVRGLDDMSKNLPRQSTIRIAASETAERANKAPLSETGKALQAPSNKVSEMLDPADSSKIADKMLTPAGKVITDKIAKETIKQGWDPAVISTIAEESTPLTKRKMKGMIEIFKNGLKSKRTAVRHRPAKIAGDSLIDRLKFLDDTMADAGKKIDTIAESSLSGKKVDFSIPSGKFTDDLAKNGVKIVENSKGEFVPDFTDSLLGKSDYGPIKELFRKMNIMRRTGQNDALSAHRLKRIIDRDVKWGKQQTSMSDDGAQILKDFRTGLDEILDGIFKQYDKYNKIYSDGAEVRDGISNSVKKASKELGENYLDEQLGTSLRTLMNNSAGRGQMTQTIDMLEEFANANGKTFDDNVHDLSIFANELERMTGSAAPTSLLAQGQQFAETGIETARTLQGQGGIVEKGLELIGKGYDATRGINEENAIKSIDAFLSR